MKLVVGLGNPGRRYAGTRHNVGFEVLGELGRRHASGKPRARFHGETCEVSIRGEQAILLCPLTFMNESGKSVLQARHFYKLKHEEILVVCDDFNLPLARLRFRSKGSSGGQNGLKDIIRRIGSDEFPRLRLGIGEPPPGWSVSDYVLGKLDKSEREVMAVAVQRAANAVEDWVAEGVQFCMNQYNGN